LLVVICLLQVVSGSYTGAQTVSACEHYESIYPDQVLAAKHGIDVHLGGRVSDDIEGFMGETACGTKAEAL
jgi:hypothetical protein